MKEKIYDTQLDAFSFFFALLSCSPLSKFIIFLKWIGRGEGWNLGPFAYNFGQLSSRKKTVQFFSLDVIMYGTMYKLLELNLGEGAGKGTHELWEQ